MFNQESDPNKININSFGEQVESEDESNPNEPDPSNMKETILRPIDSADNFHQEINQKYIFNVPQKNQDLKASIPIQIIQRKDLGNNSYIKNLKDTQYPYKIEVEITENNFLKIRIYEIEVFCPFYYENSYSKEQLEKEVSKAFKVPDNIGECQNEILSVLPRESTEIRIIEENGKKKMKLKVLISILSKDNVPVEFYLNEKIIADTDKDDALLLLYQKEKELNDKLIKIRKLCKDKNRKGELDKIILEIIKGEKK